MFVLSLGDSTYPDGALTEFTDCFQPTWGAFKDRIRPTVGNHEYSTPGAAGYFDYFGSQAGPDRRGYYSFDYAGWHFLSLNSNVDASPGSAQYTWLTQDLASSGTALCTLAYWHHPVFSSGPHGNNPQMVGVFDLLRASGGDIVLSGHDHLYERFAAQDANATPDPGGGVREFVVGTGGADLYTSGPAKANSEARIDTAHGVLQLTLGAGHYSWAFQPTGGGMPLDSGNATCRGRPPAR